MINRKNRIFVLLLATALLCSCDSVSTTNTESGTAIQTSTAITADADVSSPSASSSLNVTSPVISWSNMRTDDPSLNLTEQQRTILQYYDDDYFYISHDDNGYEALQRYPKAYRGAQIAINGVIKKILKSDDSDYTVLFQLCGTLIDESFHEPMPNEGDNLLVIQGKQGDARILEGDLMSFRGRYIDVKAFDIDGKSYHLPFMQSFMHAPASTSLSSPTELYTLADITKVAKSIFGDNIKLTMPSYDSTLYGTSVLYDRHYIVTLDDQSNDNFAKFNLYTTSAALLDSRYANYEENNVVREIHVAPDFEHFIILQYDQQVKIAYLEYYDKSYRKVWGREFSEVDEKPIYDCTINDFYIVANNDLYVLDTATGEDRHPSTFVGAKLGINLLSDGVLLVGSDTKDNLMKVSPDGNILWKTDLSLPIAYCDSIQLVDQNMVINVSETYTNVDDSKHGLAVVSPDGTVILETYADDNAPVTVPASPVSEPNHQDCVNIMGKTISSVLNQNDGNFSLYFDEQCWFALDNDVFVRTYSGFFGDNDCVNQILVQGNAYAAPGAQNGTNYDTLKPALNLGPVTYDNYYGMAMSYGSLSYNGYSIDVSVLFDDAYNSEFITLFCSDITGMDNMSSQITDIVGYVATNSGPLRMRLEPSTDSAIIMEIPKDSGVIVLAKEQNWYWVEYNDSFGFVAAEYIGF